jgi:hypothetical protein
MDAPDGYETVYPPPPAFLAPYVVGGGAAGGVGARSLLPLHFATWRIR